MELKGDARACGIESTIAAFRRQYPGKSIGESLLNEGGDARKRLESIKDAILRQRLKEALGKVERLNHDRLYKAVVNLIKECSEHLKTNPVLSDKLKQDVADICDIVRLWDQKE